jgi:hypothetical protein
MYFIRSGTAVNRYFLIIAICLSKISKTTSIRMIQANIAHSIKNQFKPELKPYKLDLSSTSGYLISLVEKRGNYHCDRGYDLIF